MKHVISRVLPLILTAIIISSAGVTAYAATETEDPTPRSDTLDALHGLNPPPKQPASLPPTPGTEHETAKDTESTESTAADTIITPSSPTTPPGVFSPLPVPAPEPSALVPTPEPAPPLYPSDVSGIEDNGVRWIMKTYELSEGESPEDIPREAFTRDGWRYALADILKKETAAADTREYTETVMINSDGKEMTDILPLLAQTLDYTSEDGYAGTLTLDISTIAVEIAGTHNESFSASEKREYPHLSQNDTSLVPKTITENGKTLTLQSVDWRAGNTQTIDYDALPEYYTAVATYTRIGTKTVVTGYIVTAEYRGEIAKLITGKTIYTAYFEGAEMYSPEPESEPERRYVNPLLITGLIAGTGLLGGTAFFFFSRKNVTVQSLKGGGYVAIGRARVTAKNPVIATIV
jgi:hypothetical protein